MASDDDLNISVHDGIRRWHVLAGLIKQRGYSTFIEVGCKEGRTTEFVAEHCAETVITAIDPWISMPQMAGVPCGETYEQWDFGAIEAEFQRRCGHRDNVRFMRMTSLEAARQSVDADLIFIDALHDEESVSKDIAAWLPRVNAGGILAGHDYNGKQRGVLRAVADAFCLMDVALAPDSVWFVEVPA